MNEILELKDIIRGDIKFDTNVLDDKVLFKSDGMPTYHLANIVDDHLMETSHNNPRGRMVAFAPATY